MHDIARRAGKMGCQNPTKSQYPCIKNYRSLYHTIVIGCKSSVSLFTSGCCLVLWFVVRVDNEIINTWTEAS
jgi:hypothetical protein